MDHVRTLHDLELVRRGIRHAARSRASDHLPAMTAHERRVLVAGGEIFDDARLTTLAALGDIPGRDDVSEWLAAAAGALAAVDGAPATPPLARVTRQASQRAVLAYTLVYACVLDALSEAALGVAADTLLGGPCPHTPAAAMPSEANRGSQ